MNEKILQLTEQYLIPVLEQFDLLSNTSKNVKKLEMCSMHVK